MFIGGTESTSTLMEWVMAELMRNPRIMEKAQAEVRQVFGKKGKTRLERRQGTRILQIDLKGDTTIAPTWTFTCAKRIQREM